MSLSAAHVTSRSIGPFGWDSRGRSVTHYKAVIPTSESSMHLNMHRNLNKRLVRKYVDDNPNCVPGFARNMEKQLLPIKKFTGIKPYNGKHVAKLSSRLAQYNPARFPAESKGEFPPLPSPQNSVKQRAYTEREISEIVKRLGKARPLKEEEVQELVSQLSENKDIQIKYFDGRRKDRKWKLTKTELEDQVNRLSSYDPQSFPADSRGQPAKERDLSDMMHKGKALSWSEIDKITERVAKYNPERWPPGSRNKSAEHPDRGKKLSGVQVNELVERLTDYKKNNWPPESYGMRQAWPNGYAWNSKIGPKE